MSLRIRQLARPASAMRLVLASLVALSANLVQFVPSATPALAASMTAPIDPALVERMAAAPAERLPVIVELKHSPKIAAGINAELAQHALSLLQLHGTAQVALPLLDSAAGLADSAGITALSLLPEVAYIHEDSAVRARADTTALESAYPRAINADKAWAVGRTGRGVTVAVLDSGIAPDPDLTQPTNRILGFANFADPVTSSRDPGGHGTHVAGIIGGNGTRSAGEFRGIAPGANLVDVRVLDRNGNGRVSSVVLGIQWALAHRSQFNIRVLNLSLGTPARTSYRLDPLAAAAEIAWERGLVVLAAAGNSGGAVDSPGIDPYVITVGATDDRQTATIGDDLVGSFSAWGTPAGSGPKPDLVAPGRRITSIRVPGSTLDQQLPDHVETATNGATYLRLTGTSMATAVASGAVALLLEQQPTLTPNQVKAILTDSAQPFGQSSGVQPNPAAIGGGMLDAYASLTSTVRGGANRGNQPADPTARSLYPALYGQPLSWRNLTLGGILWALLTWPTLTWDNLAWDNLAWDNLAWDNLAWDNLAWDNLAWDSSKWSNLAWDNLAWDADRMD